MSTAKSRVKGLDWTVELAEDFCLKVVDGTHDSPKKRESGRYLITSRHLKEFQLDYSHAYFISEEDFAEINKRSPVDQWDLLFSMIGTVGQTYLEKRENPGYAIKNVGLFKFGGNELKAKWFHYYLKTPQAKEYVHANTRGSTQQYVPLEALRKMPVRYPQNIHEMRMITDCLSALDDKIQLNDAINQNLEELDKTLFTRWFLDFEFPDERGKPYKSSGGAFVNSDLGLIPQGWEVKKIGEFCRVGVGGDWGKGEPFDGAVPVICLRGTDLQRLKEKGFATDAPVRWIKKSSLAKRALTECDILIGGSGVGPVGRTLHYVGQIQGLYPYPVVYSNFCKRIQAIDKKYAIFLERTLAELHRSGEIMGYVNGTSVPNLDVNSLLHHKFVAPPPNVIALYAQMKESFSHYKYRVENQILANLRDTILPRLMSGEIRLPPGR